MQMRLNRVPINLLASFLVAMSLAAQTGDRPRKQSQLDEDLALDRWLTGNYDKVLDLTMPSGFVQSPTDEKWTASVRIVPAFPSQWEFQFSLRRLRDGRAELSFALPMGSSVMAQLMDLRKKRPKATPEALSKGIAVAKRTLSGSEYPQLQRLADDFEGIKLSPALPEAIMLDATFYYFWLQSFSPNRIQARLGGYGPQAREQPHPLVDWAERVRNFCIESLEHTGPGSRL